ncbi:MAG: hypothetical protein KGL95_07360 [Patescibacteria group bacterium]|nr:hypothetical protein [Patescibacteria group bacterium]
MAQEKRKSKNDYGHDCQEWGLKDDSEKLEWEEHYESRIRKWGKDNGRDEELFLSRSEKNIDDETDDIH